MVEAVGDSRRNAHALVDNLADTLAEVEAVTQDHVLGDGHALVVTLEDTLAEVNALTLGDARGDAHALVDTG